MSSYPRICIIAAKVHEEILANLILGAQKACAEAGIAESSQTIVRVNGALEIPQALQHAMKSSNFDAFVVLGAVLKGETDHYDHVARLANDGVQEMALRYGKPVGNGILTVHELRHAVDRSRSDQNNLGYIAAKASIELWSSFKVIDAILPQKSTNNFEAAHLC